MPHLDARIVNISEDREEAALARLGAVTVLFWDRIAPDVRSDVLALAPLIAGIAHVPDCKAVLARLIRSNS
jgi:hypothetical protein